jgi:hypothetical protein
MGGQASCRPAMVGGRYGLDDGARPWSRRNGRRATAAVTRHGCRRGESFGGYESRRGEGDVDAERAVFGPYRAQIDASETRRTLRPAAGCNKPASRRAEKAVEVVRNHEDGTGLPRLVPRRPKSGSDVRREWTLADDVGGRAARARASGLATNPTRGGPADEATRSGRPGRSRGSGGEPRPGGPDREIHFPTR